MPAVAVKTILVVEDSATTRKFLRLSLETETQKVLEAADGIEALELLGQCKPDLFLVDLNMPRMDGITLVKRLRAHPDYTVTPIVMLTTQNTAEDRRNGLVAGVSLYLTKPIEPEKLLYKVQCLL